MYTAFFGLREKPFALSPDPRFLFLSAAHREALAHLLYGIEQGEGFIAVTGEVGTGKTTLCRTLLRRLGGEVEVAFLFNPKLSARELLEGILVEFGVEKRGDSARELVDELNHYLLERRAQGRRVLLIIDEAQGLAPDTLEQIRLLSNLETETEKLIQILLLGQPELDALLESDELRQLRQRIGVRWRLDPLSREESGEYVRHRLRVSAAADRDHLFGDAAIREIYRRSRGVPRVVNLLCDRALLAAYAEGATTVAPPHVERAAHETGAGVRDPAHTRRRLVLPLGAAAAFVAAAAATAWLTWQGRPLATEWLPWSRGAPAASAPTASSEAADVSAAPPAASALAVSMESPGVAAPSLSTGPPATALAEATAGAATATAAAPQRIDDLSHALALRAPGATAAAALAALLEAWSIRDGGEIPPVLAFPELMDQLAARGLGVIQINGADVERLRALGHPALLVADAEDGVPRVVALRRLTGSDAELRGVLADAPALVQVDALAQSWSGEAYLVWRDFEPLPDVLRTGSVGESVLWLQRGLAELGFGSGEASGRFDAQTELAVQAFQADHQLVPDGSVGPLTKMALYQALGRYGAPDVAAETAAASPGHAVDPEGAARGGPG